MQHKRILSVQDISCLGQCSMTVALPILSICGLETCILPTMVLSTHTGGLGTPHRRDLTDDILPTAEHWKQQGILFDGICVGYLGKAEQVQMVCEVATKLLKPEGKLIVDPAMADHGKLYSGIAPECGEEMKKLCRQADVILPNLTEAYLLAGSNYVEHPSRQEVETLLKKLEQHFGGMILLTGVGFVPGETGFALRDGGETHFYHRPMVGRSYHGTGDMFTAAFAGTYLQERPAYDAALLAAEFVGKVAEKTAREPAHDYGTRFEAGLPWLAQQME